MQTEQADILIQQLLADGRVVVSPWRALILLRRAARTIPRADRAWRSPRTMAQVGRILRHMRQQGQLEPVEGHRGIFHLTVPEARTSWVDEHELLFELMPYAMLSHRSAMILHGLSNLRIHDFVLTAARLRPDDLFPLGTMQDEWRGIRLPDTHHPARIMRQPLTVRTVTTEHFFGHVEDDRWGAPMRVTSVERTLVDGLIAPNLCDGIDSVLEGWGIARYDLDLDVDRVVSIVERYDMTVLQQRVGFVLEQLGLDHPRLAQWQAESLRGGSSRLVPNEPYSSDFDPRWNLSINAPIGALEEAA